MSAAMPAVFCGHGNPMNALSHNRYTRGWAALGTALPRPKAILAVSAHWYRPFSAVTSNVSPRTIHDFGGFPTELYQVDYPAPGNPDLARRVKDLLAPVAVRLDESWGLDHGTWVVLRHLFPNADIPVVQLSIDGTQAPRFHYETGQRLAALRQEGILIIGSGNVVHNLTAYAWGNRDIHPFDWAIRFEEHICAKLIKGDDDPVVDYQSFGHDVTLSVPTPEHYLPLLYVLGLRQAQEPVGFPVKGVDGGSVSMLAVRVG